jgi:hypothetical protein
MLPTAILVVSLVPAILVVSIPVGSLLPALTIAPVSTATVDHGRRGIIRGRLIDHRRRVISKEAADTDTHLRACGRGCGKRKSGKD